MIATSRANFQNPFAWLQMQRGGHGRNDIRLRNGLTAADGQRHVLIRAPTKLFWYKFVPRYCRHRRKHAGISDTAPAQLLFNHFRTLCSVFFFFKHA